MDEQVLREKGLDPKDRRLAALENFRLVIGERASLVPSEGNIVYGVIFSLSNEEIARLYSDPSVVLYRPEPVYARLDDGRGVAALSFNLPEPPSPDNQNLEYVSKLKALGRRIGLPESYVSSLGSDIREDAGSSSL